MKQKEIVRERMQGQLAASSAPYRQAASQEICQTLAQSPAWRHARLVCAFFPLPSEPDIRPLWSAPGGPAFCFPRIVGERLELVRVEDSGLLARTTWRMQEADLAACPTVALAQVDLILVPGVAFTTEGHRLGRGRGYYDRLLATCPPSTRTWGVCFQFQRLAELPTEGHDQRVQQVITDSGQP